MIKRVKDYVTEITAAINRDSPVYGMTVTEQEVEKVLRYHLKNLKKVMQKETNEVYITNKLWFFPLRKFVLHRQSRKQKKNILVGNI